MDFTISHFEFGQRPAVTLPSPEFLHLLTEEGIRKLVSDHYDLIMKSTIVSLFPPAGEPLEKAKLRSSDFFIQVLGGHPYYHENRGKPMLVKRHNVIIITPEARIVWLECYAEVLSKLVIPVEVLYPFWNYLNIFSSWMVNTEKPNQGK
jgi:hemoglobin